MNKLLILVKYILFIICMFFVGMFFYKYNFLRNVLTFSFISMLVLFLVALVLNIIDLLGSKKVNKLVGYNILSIIDLLVILFIFGRTLFDKSIISNQLDEYYYIYGFKYCMFYCYFIGILLVLNVIYYFINTKKIK